MVHAKINCKGQKEKTREFPINLSNAYDFSYSVCSGVFVFIIRAIFPVVGVSLSVSRAEIYQNWAIGFVLSIF